MNFTVVVLYSGDNSNLCIRNVEQIRNVSGYFVLETAKEDYYFNWYEDDIKAVFITNKELK